MKRIKLELPAGSRGTPVLGLDAKLFDADTGEELENAADIRLDLPMDGVATVTVRFPVAEIEVR